MSAQGRSRVWRYLVTAAALVAAVALTPAHAADPSKVIRHVFPAAETG